MTTRAPTTTMTCTRCLTAAALVLCASEVGADDRPAPARANASAIPAAPPVPAPVAAPAAAPAHSSDDELLLALAGTETIVLEERWLGTDLVAAEETTRAVTVRRAAPRADTAVLGDLLDGVPGLSVQRTGPGQGAPMVRGMIGSAVLVLVDGMRLNNAIFRPAPNQYAALVDPWAVDRVEIVRGPGSALHGSDALGGTINVVTPLPVFDGDDWGGRGDAVVAVDTADRSVISRASAAAGRRGSGVSLGLTLQHHDDLRAGGGEVLAPSAYRSLAADATGHLERGRHASTAWLQLALQPELPRTDELRPGIDQDAPAAAEWHYRPSRRAALHLRHLVRRPIAGVRGAELHLAWQHIDDDRRIRDSGATTTTVEANRDDSLGLTARASAPAAGGELVVGAEYWADLVGSRRAEVAAGGEMTAPGRFADGAHMHQGAAFGQLRRTLGAVTLQAGARSTLVALRVPAADRGAAAAVIALDWAAELGGQGEVAPGIFVVANAGRGFRAPNVHDLSSLGPRPGGRWQIPADDLAAEHATGADLGVRVDRDAIAAELFGFGLLWSDRIEVTATGEVTDDGRMIVRSANTGRTRLAGLEAALELRPWPTLAIAGHASLVHGAQSAGDDADEPADRVPPLGGSAEVRWSRGRVRIEGGLRWAAAQHRLSARDRDDPRIDPDGTAGFFTVHGAAALRLGSTDLLLRVDNMLDRRYREHGSGTDAPGFGVGVLLRHRYETQ